tara:strand:+ start:293 stop:796 length:504 start_codon:yes stop_codon:yes gene_type:complete
MAVSLDMRSDNWLRQQINKLERRNEKLQMRGGIMGTINQAMPGVFDKKIKEYKALLEKRGQAPGQSRSDSGPHEQDFTNEWGDQGIGGLATQGGDDFGYLSAVQQPGQINTGNVASQIQTFSPQTAGAANEMFGAEAEEESFDRILPPTPGMINPDGVGINSLYNTN